MAAHPGKAEQNDFRREPAAAPQPLPVATGHYEIQDSDSPESPPVWRLHYEVRSLRGPPCPSPAASRKFSKGQNMRFRIDSLITLAGAACVTIFTCSKLNHVYSADRTLLSQPSNKVKFQSLGEDDDWNVHEWSKKHLSAVSADNVDKPSVKNIWHSKSEAWSGIDRIFPTEGGFAYQTNHFLNGKTPPHPLPPPLPVPVTCCALGVSYFTLCGSICSYLPCSQVTKPSFWII